MKNIILVIAALLWGHGTQAQDFNNYTPLKGEGQIPEEFTTPSTLKYSVDLKELSKGGRRAEKKAQKEFLLASNFFIDDVLQSGKVLFNDPLTNYLTRVAQEVCSSDPDLKEKVRVYAVRSAGVNAFATKRGTIFVTIGLLAQLENEAQLAYIIAHEMVHVRENHAMELFLQSERFEKTTSARDLSIDKTLFSKNQYSKEIEAEADIEGLTLMMQSRYSTENLDRVFDVLKYAYLPFDEIPFDKQYFETESYVFPSNYYMEQVQPISGIDEQENDEKHMHPNIGKRRAAASELIKGANNEGKLIYLVSKDDFDKMRDIARFEIPKLYLHQDDPVNAIYAAYILQKKYPESPYLKKVTGQALYIAAKYKNIGADFLTPYQFIEGQSQRVFFLLDTMRAKELNILALRYNFNLLKTSPGDEDIKLITQDLFLELTKHFETLNVFANEVRQTPDSINTANKEATSSAGKEEGREKSKYDRIKEKKLDNGAQVGTLDYWAYAFVGMLNDTSFTNGFEKGISTRDANQKLEKYRESKEGQRTIEARLKKESKQGYRMGIKRIVVVNPKYFNYDDRPRKQDYNFIEAEEQQIDLSNYYETLAKKAKIDVTVLDVCKLEASETDKFNDIKELNEWFSEQQEHSDLSLTPGFNQAAINEIAQKYGTDYFLWTGVVQIRFKNPLSPYLYMSSVVWPFLLPYLSYRIAKPRHEIFFIAILYDVRTGKYKVIKESYFEKGSINTLVKSQIYDALLQISRSPKGKK